MSQPSTQTLAMLELRESVDAVERLILRWQPCVRKALNRVILDAEINYAADVLRTLRLRVDNLERTP